MTHLSLFLQFAKFGLLCFGGGYMLIPLIVAEFVDRTHFFTLKEFGNFLSISQVTPGPVGINMATYTGFLHGGFTGAAAATFGLVFPTLVLGIAAVAGIRKYKDAFLVRGILKGARTASAGLILYAATIFLGMSVFTDRIPWKNLLDVLLFRGWDPPSAFGFSPMGALFCALAVLAMLKTRISTTWIIAGSAALGALSAVFF